MGLTMKSFKPFGSSWLDSPGFCVRELKPGVARENHRLTDHLPYGDDVIEQALVFDKEGKALFWLGPKNNTAGSIPDSHLLWDRIWTNRHDIGGVAHTHPWDGEVWPSGTDLTTFDAIERGLGQKLVWPILTFTEVKYYVNDGLIDGQPSFKTTKPPFADSEAWKNNMQELRRLSQTGG